MASPPSPPPFFEWYPIGNPFFNSPLNDPHSFYDYPLSEVFNEARSAIEPQPASSECLNLYPTPMSESYYYNDPFGNFIAPYIDPIVYSSTYSPPVIYSTITSTTSMMPRVPIFSPYRPILDQRLDPPPATQLISQGRATVLEKEPFVAEDCVICFMEMQQDKYVRKLNCSHWFHKACINKWLKMNRTCPICRKYVPRTVKKSRPNP